MFCYNTLSVQSDLAILGGISYYDFRELVAVVVVAVVVVAVVVVVTVVVVVSVVTVVVVVLMVMVAMVIVVVRNGQVFIVVKGIKVDKRNQPSHIYFATVFSSLMKNSQKSITRVHCAYLVGGGWWRLVAVGGGWWL